MKPKAIFVSDSYNRKKIDFNTYAMEITEIKSSLQLETVLQHYNLKPDANNRLSCPWHDDKTPSLQLYPKTNTWTCFRSIPQAKWDKQVTEDQGISLSIPVSQEVCI